MLDENCAVLLKIFSFGQPNDSLCFRVRMRRRTNRDSELRAGIEGNAKYVSG
jgi:hypothetical protein